MRLALSAPVLCLACAGPALAEVEVGLYGGWQTAPHSGLSISGDAELADRDLTAGWEGRSLDMPPQWGVRATWWRGDWGLGVEVNHAKVTADDETLAESGLDRLEFTDGLNIATLNGVRRFPEAFGRVTPYLGAGIGVAVPHVEVIEGETETWGYQLTGPAVAWMAGASVPLAERWSLFGEYKGTFSANTADLDGGGTLSTDIVTNALNLGVSLTF